MFLYFTTSTSHSFHILFLTDQMKGFVSIFQLLRRCRRRISVVFDRYFTARDNRHVGLWLHKEPVRLTILRNFEVHKLRTRKIYLTEPLRRNIEPHCGINKPLRRNIEPLRRNIEPLRGNVIEPLRRKFEHFSSKGNHDRISQCRNVESVYGINKSFSGNRNPALHGESTCQTSCQTTVRKSFSDRETIDVKAVVNHYENSYEIIIPRNCDMIDVNNDRYSNERSIKVYRLTVRKLCKQSKINGHLHSRDREPSRIPAKKVIQIMRKRKLRQKFKTILRKSIPASSKLFHLITNYKLWHIHLIHRNLHSFYTAYFLSMK